jgi:DNA polymerase III delta subunit
MTSSYKIADIGATLPLRYNDCMIIFLYGPDDYRRLQKKRDLIAEFRRKRSDLALGVFDFETKEGVDDFLGFARSGSLFEPMKLAVLDNAFEMASDGKAGAAAGKLAKLLEPFVADKAINILLAERDKPVKALGFLLEKPVISQKFENLEGAEWLAFAAAEAKKLGVRLAPAATQFLATVFAGNSWALATELQKLSGWQPSGAGGVGASRAIDKKDLEAFDLEAAPDYWMLLNGLKSFDARVQLSTLERLFAMNDAPAKIFNILASQWKDLSKNSAAQMAEFDFAVKSGKLEYEEALVDLVIG